MKGLYLEAKYAPRAGYRLSVRESAGDHRALNGNAIWKDPRMTVRNDLPVPQPGENEILVKVKYCGVCGSDVHMHETDADGYMLFPGHTRLPLVIGHEFSGEVVEIGKSVRSLSVGDMVVVESMDWCGECGPCRAGFFNQCRNLEEIGFTVNGGFGEYVTAHAKYALKINDLLQVSGDADLAYRLGAMVEPTACSYNGTITAAGGIKPGQHAAVFGAGTIGCAAIQILRAGGAAMLFAFETRPERRVLATASGATHVYDPLELQKAGSSPSEVVMDLTHGQGVGMGVEAAGANRFTVPEIEKMLAVNGKMVQIGMVAGATPMQLQTFQFRRASMFGSIGSSGHDNWLYVIQLMAARRIDMSCVNTATFDLEQAIQAIDDSAGRTGGKVLVRLS